MDRRQFLRSVILGTLAAPFVTRQVKAVERWPFPSRINASKATNPYWQRQYGLGRAAGKDAYENLRAAMRDIHAQCQRDLDRRVQAYDMDRVQVAVNQRLACQL